MSDQLAFQWPGTEDQLHPVNDRDQWRELWSRTFDCGVKRSYHPPHQVTRDGTTYECPGLQTKPCSDMSDHDWHVWATPTRLFWCQPYDRITNTARETI